MECLSYIVTAHLPNEAVRDEYVDWLLNGHIQAVVAGGATAAEVIQLDGPGNRVQSRYQFPDASAFSRYLEQSAPALRADGLKRFGGVAGVEFFRETGTIAGSIGVRVA